MDFELTRSENDKTLLSQIDSIKTAENIQVLIPFAKAYLGMFYVIDKELSEKEKVKLLANDELAEAILHGFLSSLNCSTLPSVESIGHAKAEKQEFPEGYVVLAGLDLVAKKSLSNIKELKSEFIERAIAFHFSNKTGYHDIWFDYLFTEQKNEVIPALTKYWVAILNNNATYLPGRDLILGERADVQIIEYCILSLLDSWSHCKIKTLSQLLHLAFKHSNTREFLLLCERVLEKDSELNERTRLYWLTAAYLLSPDKYFYKLSSYVGRVKLKVMPLLDFVVLVINDNQTEFNAKVVTQLLRMIAPVFPPQFHIYGAIGELDINSKNVMLMFYYLASVTDVNAVNEIKLLRKARVMKIYSAVIDDLLELRIRNHNAGNFNIPSFDDYIENLVDKNCLQGRSNKFDLR